MYSNVFKYCLYILVPPSVRTEPASGEITVREGTSVSLECRSVNNLIFFRQSCRLGIVYFSDLILHKSRFVGKLHFVPFMSWYLKIGKWL
jgi:hypothetical protein